MKTLTGRLFSAGPEPLIWVAALLYLALIDPASPSIVSLCPLHNLGLSFCPGCGLGHSVSFFLHGDINASLACHPLGIVTAVILAARTVSLIARSSDRTTALQHLHT